MPTVEEIFGKIGKASHFAKLDLKSAYWQIALDEKAKELSIINTHKSLFSVNRLQMGMKNASAVFQRCMENILMGNIQGVIVYQDDVMLCADSDGQLKRRLRQRLKERAVTLNDEKCIEATNELKFLGFVFGKQGIKPDMTLINKISNAERPKDKKELSGFLGMANYHGRFIQNFAEICSPFHDAKKSVREHLTWDDRCEKSSNLLKAKLTSVQVLQPFSQTKQSVLAVDASRNAIEAVLSQAGHPVLYVSRKLSPTETNYSNRKRGFSRTLGL